jgi:hypothetical protein
MISLPTRVCVFLTFVPCCSIAYLAWFFYTVPSERNGKGRPWPKFENAGLWRTLFEWFPMRIVVTQPLEQAKQYMFGVHPHGGLAVHRGMFGFCTKTLWEHAFPGIEFRVLTATAAFRVGLPHEPLPTLKLPGSCTASAHAQTALVLRCRSSARCGFGVTASTHRRRLRSERSGVVRRCFCTLEARRSR